MKQIVYVAALVFTLASASLARAQELMIGLSPFQEPAQAETQVKAVLQFLTQQVPQGGSALVFDAYSLRTLGVFAVPEKSAYRHPKAKIKTNRQMVANLFQFARQAHIPVGGQEPRITGAIRWPQALRFVGEHYPASQGSDVILLGSPLFDDPAEKDFSMSQGLIPGDGHLTHGRSVTPYGIQGQDTLLTNWRVHLGFPDATWRRDDHHGYFVQRFWTLHVEGQGGAMVTFTGDLPTLWQRVRTNAPAPPHAYRLEGTDKLEMIVLRPPVVREQPSIYERPLTRTPLASELVHQAPNVEIGLSWDCAECDLDLYARNGPDQEVLFYRHKESASGHYFKDWMRSPRATHGFETIVFYVPVDLHSLWLAVNFYGGTTKTGVQGELRLSLAGQTYARTFHFTPQAGNNGEGRETILETGTSESPHWMVIDPTEVLGLTDPVLTQR